MYKARGLLLTIALAVIAALAIVACGGDDDDDKNGGSAATATATRQASDATEGAGSPTDEPGGEGEPTDKPDDATQPPAGAISASDSCKLLTQSELEDALGEPMQEPVAVEVLSAPLGNGASASVGGCGFTTESFASSISLTYWSAPGQEEGIRGMIELACGSGQEAISGLGDRACWYDDRHAQIQLARGETFLDIFATMSGDASDALLTLAQKAISKTS